MKRLAECGLLLLLCVCLQGQSLPFPGPGTMHSTGGGGAVAHDGTANVSGTNTAATTLTITGKTTTGSNRLGVVSCAWNAEQPTITGATWNGVAMTIADQGAEVTNCSIAAGLLYIVNPPTASSNVVVTWNQASTARCIAHSYTGVNQTTPVGTSSKVITTTQLATPISNTGVTTATGEVVVDAVSYTKFDGGETVTVGANQTQLLNTVYATAYFALASWQAGVDGNAMTWAFSGGGTACWVTIADTLKP